MMYNCFFKEMCSRKFIEHSDWHPAFGRSYYRPLDLSVSQFYSKCYKDGFDWLRWKEIRNSLPPLLEMMDVLEESGYRFVVRDGITDFTERPVFEMVQCGRSIEKISKHLVRSVMDRHPVLNGSLYDPEIKKRNALSAIRLIRQGETVKDALKKCKSSYPSIRQFGYKGTERQNPRKTIKKVKKVLFAISTGEKLKTLLKENRLGAWSYYRYRGYF